MTKYILKMLSDTGGILTADGERIGLVTKKDDSYTILGKEFSGSYDSVSILEKKLGKKLHIEQQKITPISEPETGNVNGFPIKHTVYHNVQLEPIPNYTRTPTSEIRYAAGYFGIKFQTGWIPSFCPKLTTLNENEYIGPYTSKVEMQHQISNKGKIPNV